MRNQRSVEHRPACSIGKMVGRWRAGQGRSRVVQSRRPDRDRSWARRDAQYAAADPALARQADAERELASVVVMAAQHHDRVDPPRAVRFDQLLAAERIARSEEHTSELQSLMRISYAVFCLKKKTIEY